METALSAIGSQFTLWNLQQIKTLIYIIMKNKTNHSVLRDHNNTDCKKSYHMHDLKLMAWTR